MFGCALPRMETNAYYSSIEELHFHFVEFNDLIKYFNFIKTLKTVTTLHFHHNNIHSLYQIDALSVISHLKEVDFGAERGSNPITQSSPSLYRLYCVFRLPNIQRIDGQKVSADERDVAKQQFSLLRNEWKNARILLTRGFCAPILNELRNVNAVQTEHFKENINGIFQQFPFVKDPVNKQDETSECVDAVDHKARAQESIQRAIAVFKSRQKLRSLWPSIVAEYIREVAQDLQAT